MCLFSVACLVWWHSFRPQIYDESETDQILNAKYFVWKNYTLGKSGTRKAFNQNSLMQLFKGDRPIVHCKQNKKINSHFTSRSRKVDAMLLSRHWWKGQQHRPQLFTCHAFFLSHERKNQSLLTQICGQQLRNPLYWGVCPSQLTDHHRIVGKAMSRWAQANSPTLHLPFLVTTTQIQLFNRQPIMHWFKNYLADFVR